ncbi:MAG: hypothetical protein AB1500_12785 [Bacillota bacterium]
METKEIALKLVLEAIKKHGLKAPEAEGVEFNKQLAESVAEMYKIVYEAVSSYEESGEINDESLSDLIRKVQTYGK